jgi:hypothetical protein
VLCFVRSFAPTLFRCNAPIADALFRWLAKADVTAASGGRHGSSEDEADAEINSALAQLASGSGGAGSSGPAAVLPRAMMGGARGKGMYS